MSDAMRKGGMLALFIGVCLGGGGLGSLATTAAIPTWYAGLAKPAWTPPNAVFGPVWTALYVMIGIAGWVTSRRSRKDLLILWFLQLALNFAWTPLFFGAHEIGWGLLDIFVMWLLIGWFIAASWRPAKPAAILFLPYWAWVSYATALNYAIWTLSRSG